MNFKEKIHQINLKDKFFKLKVNKIILQKNLKTLNETLIMILIINLIII